MYARTDHGIPPGPGKKSGSGLADEMGIQIEGTLRIIIRRGGKTRGYPAGIEWQGMLAFLEQSEAPVRSWLIGSRTGRVGSPYWLLPLGLPAPSLLPPWFVISCRFDICYRIQKEQADHAKKMIQKNQTIVLFGWKISINPLPRNI